MKHFNKVQSLSNLKQQYRKLAIQNHPDKGGEIRIMQEINNEFEQLYEIWKIKKETTNTGYETDYSGATAKQYTEYVYNEYRYKGSRYNSKLKRNDLAKIFRAWAKETYPNCQFSIIQSHGRSFNINLMKADFHAFKDNSKVHENINHYHLNNDNVLTDRAKEVFSNVINFIESYNYDDSDMMTDYYNVNFYSSYAVGKWDKNFEYAPLKLGTNERRKEYKRKIGPTQKKINEAMGGHIFREVASRNGDKKMILCKNSDAEAAYSIISYSQPSILDKKVEKLKLAGIETRICGRMYQSIEFLGFADGIEDKLRSEKLEEDKKEADFYNQSTESAERPERTNMAGVQIINYSDRAVAVIGETKEIKDILKKLGGKFNFRLTCGAGWIFPKSKENDVKIAIGL